MVPSDGVREPILRRGSVGGSREYVLPGNKKYVQGDTIARPEEEEGGSGASDGGEGEDDFRFALSDEEFLDLFLEDLELPDLAKRQVMGAEETQPVRAGYRSSALPASLSVVRTMRNSLSRRTALGPAQAGGEWRRCRTRSPSSTMKAATTRRSPNCANSWRSKQRKMKLVPFIDPLDVRYRRYDRGSWPVAPRA